MAAGKFEIEKLDGSVNFGLWQVKMKALLVQSGLEKALTDQSTSKLTSDQWEEKNAKALSAIQLCLSNEVLMNVLKETTATGIWSKLESLYMTRTLSNKLLLRQRFFMLRMTEGMSVKSYLNNWLSASLDLERIGDKIDEEIQAMLLLCSLPASYQSFRETFLYGRSNITVDEVRSALLSKELIDKELTGEVGRPMGETIAVSMTRSKDSGGVRCFHCGKKGHIKRYCRKLTGKDEGLQESTKVAVCTSDSETQGDFLMASEAQTAETESERLSDEDWILDSGSTFHMSPHRAMFTTYCSTAGGEVRLGNGHKCKVAGVGTVRLKMKDGVVRELAGVRHVPDITRNIISVSVLEARGYEFSASGGALNVRRGRRLWMTGIRLKGLYMVRGAVAITTVRSSGRRHEPFKRRSKSSEKWGNRSRARRSKKMWVIKSMVDGLGRSVE